MSDIYSEKQIAKEITLAILGKVPASFIPDGQGADIEKMANQAAKIFEIVHKSVKRSET